MDFVGAVSREIFDISWYWWIVLVLIMTVVWIWRNGYCRKKRIVEMLLVEMCIRDRFAGVRAEAGSFF